MKQLKHVKVVGDGALTKIYDAETGEEIGPVKRLELIHDAKQGRPVALITTLTLVDEMSFDSVPATIVPPPVESLLEPGEVRLTRDALNEEFRPEN